MSKCSVSNADPAQCQCGNCNPNFAQELRATEQGEAAQDLQPESHLEPAYLQLLEDNGLTDQQVRDELDSYVSQGNINSRMYRVLKACIEVASGA